MRRGVGKVPGAALDYTNGGEPRRRPVNVSVPGWLKTAGTNLARTATVHAADTEIRTSMLLNDGNGNVMDNGGRWLGRGVLPHVVEFRWDKPVTLGAARVVSGYNQGGRLVAPVRDFSLQWFDGGEWKGAGESVTGNENPGWAVKFDPVRTTRMRLVITKTKDDVSRIWEVEFYGAVGE